MTEKVDTPYHEIRRIRKEQREAIKTFKLVDQKYLRVFYPDYASKIIKEAQKGSFPRIKHKGKWYYNKQQISFYCRGLE